jgi:cellulose synthase/poly-beta-1,6-N-acetylglucosamine synthase-like glycosyltransferase
MLGALFYTYFGYPLLLALLLKFKKAKEITKNSITPIISLVIAAYNEEKDISAKLNGILNSDYSKDKMEVVVISDCSSDDTDKIVAGFADKGVRLFRLEQRTGKIGGYRKVIGHLKGEIIVFSDATSLLSPDSISSLVGNFADPKVGCAGGLLAYMNPKNAGIGEGEDQYWGYETRIRDMESSLGSLTSVSGTLYAVRKDLYPLDIKDYLADDLIVPIRVIKAGFRVVLEKKAVCREFTTLNIDEEMKKRVRITSQNIRGLIDQMDILNPFRYGLYSILVISHKLFRLLVPIFLIAVFLANSILMFSSKGYMLIMFMQILFYAGAMIGYRINKLVKFSIGNSLFYFCLSNWAILVGIARSFKGEKVVTWETMRPEY